MITSPGFQNCPKFRGAVEVMRHVVVSKPGDETPVGATPIPTSVRDRRLCARKQARKNAGDSIFLRRNGVRSHDRAEHRHRGQGKSSWL
jgi:hypothetical protein